MKMYQRYVYDSNQLAEVAPPKTVYEDQTAKLKTDEKITINETEEERTV